MILANVRAQFTVSDAECVITALAEGDHAREVELRGADALEGLAALLDDPALPDRLETASLSVAPSAALLLYVAVRHRLRVLGIDDVELSDYLAALLLEFGRHQRAYRIAGHDDATYRYLADIVAELARVDGRRAFLLRAHLGNYSLWLSGLFPDYIAARRHRRGAPGLAYFESLGARGFRWAADHRLARDYDLAELYARAADAFGVLRIALNRVSDRLLFPHWHSADRLLRQVKDGAALG
jgi:hypothetical protein